MANTARLTERVFRKLGFGGFTLAELIVVITILAILATIGFLTLSGYSQDAKTSAVKANVRSIYTSIGVESAITGNSPRYYVVHDPSASISGAFVYVDGKSVILTGGNWNDANTNYSAGNPNYVKLKLNPDKFRISGVGNVFDTVMRAFAAYDSNAVSIGAADVQGTVKTSSYYQVSGIAPSWTTVVIGNYSASSGSIAGLIDDPTSSGTWALTDGQTIIAGATANLATATLPKGKLTIAYNNGAGYDFKPLFSVSWDATYDSASVVWALTSWSLPAGLSFGANGVITGTPTALNAGATFEITGTYSGKTAKQTYTLVVIDNLLEAVQISNGTNSTCAVTPAGWVKCWGDNSQWQLGDGTTTARLVPVDVAWLTSGVVEVSAGNNYACAVLTNGTVKCWGNNQYGQLGKWTTGGTVLTATGVSGIASWATHVTAWQRHACAIVSWAAKCWGYNYNYQLGNSSSMDSNVPVAVTGLTSGVTDLSAGDTYTCAVANGGAKCWGNNASYQFWDGTTTSRNAPVDAGGMTSWVAAISAGIGTCVITTSGWAKCWGGYSWNGTTANQPTPVDVTGMTSWVSKIRVGNNGHTCLLTTGWAAYCWGTNGWSWRTGDGISYNNVTSVPTAVSGSASWLSDISAGSDGCALKTDNTVKCWGYYAGNNTSSAQYSPVPVMGG